MEVPMHNARRRRLPFREHWHLLTQAAARLTITRARSRYLTSAGTMTLLMLLMSAYAGSLVPFALMIFGQVALFLLSRVPGLYPPAVVTAVSGCLIGIMIPWVFLSQILGEPSGLTVALSLLLSTLSQGPYWLIEIVAELAGQIRLES
jgi:hypothetical protein